MIGYNDTEFLYFIKEKLIDILSNISIYENIEIKVYIHEPKDHQSPLLVINFLIDPNNIYTTNFLITENELIKSVIERYNIALVIFNNEQEKTFKDMKLIFCISQ